MTDVKPTAAVKITNGKPVYYRKENKIFEEVDIIQNVFQAGEDHDLISSRRLYRNCCEIGYQLPENIKLETID